MFCKKNIIVDGANDDIINYKDIIDKCIHEEYYYPVLRHNSFHEFLINFIKALIRNYDIILLDSDFTDEEIRRYKLINYLNVKENIILGKYPLKHCNFQKYIINSRSQITLFTSGTTGIPKKITHTISSLLRMVRIDNKYAQNIWGLAYNPTHMAGLQVILQAILNGNSIINLFNCPINKVVDYFRMYQISHISATPTFYRLLLSSKVLFDKVVRVSLGGEKSDSILYGLIHQFFPNAKINNIYATTEFGSLLISDGNIFKIPEEIRNRVKIVNNELYVEHSLIPGHSGNEWYKTGDEVKIVSVKPLSFKFLCRKNEMINIGGNKVNPGEIEDFIRTFPEINEVRVYGRDNSVLGKILCADVVLTKDAKLGKKDFFERMRILVQDFKIPRLLYFVEKIETTRTGKLSRK